MKLFNEIYEAMRNKFLSLNSSLTNFNINSRIRALFEAVAEALERLWFYADTILQAVFVTTAKDTYLDKRALEMGLVRRATQKAWGIVTFTGEQGTIIPLGTIVSTNKASASVVEFITTKEVEIPTGDEVDVDIEAVVAGTSGNVEAGKIDTLVSSVPGVAGVENKQAIAGGADEETDAELRQRLILRWYAPSYGPTNNTIRAWCLELRGVADTRVIGNFPEPGKAQVLVWSRNQVGALVPASIELVAQTQTLLDERRPVCFILTAVVPTGILVDVETEIAIEEGYEFLNVAESVKAIIESHFAGLGVGDDVLVAELLYTVMGITGVANAAIIEPETDVIIGVSDTALLGDNIVSAME